MEYKNTLHTKRNLVFTKLIYSGKNVYIIDTEISSRKKDYVKMIRKMH